MSKEMAVIALGVWLVVVPYLGVPGSWRTVLLLLTGVALVVLGLFLRADSLWVRGRKNEHHSFVENGFTATPPHSDSHEHEHKEGIGSLN
ncbi:hypothetical protein HYS79_00015 [Patescibacteria group bacterium]|nr:hypothetical protein [Patescibacteria group bacterium]